jgi:hypothetical protein
VVNELIVSENMSLNSKPMFGITVSMPESWWLIVILQKLQIITFWDDRLSGTIFYQILLTFWPKAYDKSIKQCFILFQENNLIHDLVYVIL